MNTSLSIPRGPLLVLALLLTTAACDSSGDDQTALTEVAGTYTFAQFVFDPTTSALQNVNVLDTLMSANTRLRLFEDGQYTLEYQFRGGLQSVATGTFSANASRVTLTSNRNDRDRLKAMLLQEETSLSRTTAGGTTLTASIDKTVNLQEFSSKYAGLTAIPGTLLLRLTRQ